MSAQSIFLAKWIDGAWIDPNGNPYVAPALSGGASFMANCKDGESSIVMLIPGDEPFSDNGTFEGCCPICGEYQVLALKSDWHPVAIDLTCIMCRTIPAQVDNTQEPIKKVEKGEHR